MGFKVVIPARYGATRLPGKPLLDWHGRPILQWVYDAACASGADEVIVATDDPRVISALRPGPDGRPPRAMLTDPSHPSGTDRVAEIARSQELGWSGHDIVVNLQGDEPQMPPVLIDQVAGLVADDSLADIATLCTPIASLEQFLDPNVVKVVRAGDGAALYFSRAPIPWDRDAAGGSLVAQTSHASAMRHLGLYAYRVDALARLTTLAPSSLEQIERLEQLRALEAGMRIAVGIAARPPGIGVDTPEDLEQLRQLAPD
ncbi:MAG TPA: 3-deoxy-manno-octulosonate cytidylyltransferase [Steroidobacteraceae bacterium]|nr:3-deoxy-manno-octulosonate cytidylyltransferase [Steroidobacteraceae bacterium]